MLLHEYLENIRSIIKQLAHADLIFTSDINGDFRTEKIGIVSGKIDFIDESTLHFKKYLDLRYGLEILNYSIHYQKKNGDLVFRYDNAKHKPKLEYQDHKHLSDGRTIPSKKIPEFEDILNEIIDQLL